MDDSSDLQSIIAGTEDFLTQASVNTMMPIKPKLGISKQSIEVQSTQEEVKEVSKTLSLKE